MTNLTDHKSLNSMRYQFKTFEFNSESLVLIENGEAIEIRHNEAKVLALFLENTEKVLSKEEILSSVWQDKVVSDQAVFQNISHLRNLFGNAAIKTFSKRGYQWQLDVKLLSDPDRVDIEALNLSHGSGHSTHSKKNSLQPFAWA
ncbi:MAG: winged helix-turn-helix domain-containing protein, partial [Kangiellaceae bacterium]|nr:winged helix-turn-helix domain-containing protein [Kangiellaceae bacterium]